jgi:nucleotide-binding universal stress UspA family protein
MYARILVPTDFSEPSDAALAHAKALAARFGASLHLVHVTDDATLSGLFGIDSVPAPDTATTAAATEIDTYLDAQLGAAERTRFRATSDVLQGPVAMTIVNRANEIDASLIVMGTHGRTGVTHAILGSVAETVVRHAACPVLTVHAMPSMVVATVGNWAQAIA